MRAFKKNPKYVSRFGQHNILSQNTDVIDVQSALVVERQLHTNNSWLWPSLVAGNWIISILYFEKFKRLAIGYEGFEELPALHFCFSYHVSRSLCCVFQCDHSH